MSTTSAGVPMLLPDGWKPFGVVDGGLNRIFIVARKWHRSK